ncbi:30S ribosomal protein S8 [Candidatus Gottesmanbacteria bacterium RBG_13_45_10]|uniref:Small ribosomal subunit protein uS8 n=1 Tax=Candidatus Gottesmanbacteria bacterium RBG_13_45_10 TaxID=1798370 RepID=A0A1F5ZH99_9BACT|nr:MAG: 30S ribosomal protein S8 [Candidatus Gottesmanbacteria bacterium RBG_13_45_10]
MAGLKTVELPHSRMKMAVAKILTDEGYIASVEKAGKEPKFSLRIGIKYQDATPVITDVKRMSKPGLRIYVNKDMIPTVVGGMGIAILSTPQGVMTGKEAKKRGLGGELLCTIW